MQVIVPSFSSNCAVVLIILCFKCLFGDFLTVPMAHAFLFLLVFFSSLLPCQDRHNLYLPNIYLPMTGWMTVDFGGTQITNSNKSSKHTHRIWGIWHLMHKKLDATCEGCCQQSCGESRIVSWHSCIKCEIQKYWQWSEMFSHIILEISILVSKWEVWA